MKYQIRYTNGAISATIATYEEACAIVRSHYPEAEIGHDGDLTGGVAFVNGLAVASITLWGAS